MANQVNETKFIDKRVTLILDPNSINSKLEYNYEDIANDKFLFNRLARFGYFWQTKEAYLTEIIKE